MIPLSLVFAVFAFVGVVLHLVADDQNYRKIGLYIFLVFFMLMSLQMVADYPAQQNITAVIILFSVSLLIITFLLDLMNIFQTVIGWINKRR